MAVARPRFGIGASVLQVEDKACLIGQGQYTDDFTLIRKVFEQSAMTEVLKFQQNQIASNQMKTRVPVGKWRESENIFPFTTPKGRIHGRLAQGIAATPAVMNAVINGLLHGYGITHIDMPATPFAIWQAIHNAKAKAA